MPALLLIVTEDRLANPQSGTWRSGQITSAYDVDVLLGTGQQVSAGAFYHFTVTDKTKEEMQTFLDPYNKAIDMNVIAGPDPQGFRRINVRNNNCNVSGTTGAWTVEATDKIVDEWNSRYPTCNLTTVAIITGTNPNDTWQCEGTFTTGQAIEFEEVIVEEGLQAIDARRIWFITPAGMQNIADAGGTQSGTSVQLSGILQDAREV